MTLYAYWTVINYATVSAGIPGTGGGTGATGGGSGTGGTTQVGALGGTVGQRTADYTAWLKQQQQKQKNITNTASREVTVTSKDGDDVTTDKDGLRVALDSGYITKEEYAKGLVELRNNGVIDNEEYKLRMQDYDRKASQPTSSTNAELENNVETEPVVIEPWTPTKAIAGIGNSIINKIIGAFTVTAGETEEEVLLDQQNTGAITEPENSIYDPNDPGSYWERLAELNKQNQESTTQQTTLPKNGRTYLGTRSKSTKS